MKRMAWTVAAVTITAAVALVGACGDDEGSGSGGGGQGGPNCAPTDPACPAVGVPSDCLSLVDNSGKDVFALRLAQLSLSKPAALASSLIYGIVGDGVNINLPACNVGGRGLFSLMLLFDKTAGTLTVGGAYPLEDPTQGYCFVEDPVNEVTPLTVQSNLNADGSFDGSPIARVVMPIFLEPDASRAVYLPVSNARITSAQLSADQNCIGSFNADGLDPAFSCAPDPGDGIELFINGASLTGYITLEDADAVEVDLLKKSLCVVLSDDAATYGDGDATLERCTRDGTGKILLEGDWCSTTDSAGGCKDSFSLAADLAASGATMASACP